MPFNWGDEEKREAERRAPCFGQQRVLLRGCLRATNPHGSGTAPTGALGNALLHLQFCSVGVTKSTLKVHLIFLQEKPSSWKVLKDLIKFSQSGKGNAGPSPSLPLTLQALNVVWPFSMLWLYLLLLLSLFPLTAAKIYYGIYAVLRADSSEHAPNTTHFAIWKTYTLRILTARTRCLWLHPGRIPVFHHSGWAANLVKIEMIIASVTGFLIFW